MPKIPIDIIGDNEVKILEYLPEPNANEQEDAYLVRCVPVLYPEYYDQIVATALCADKLQRKITVTTLKKIMKAEKMSAFDKKRLEFQIQLALKQLKEKGIDISMAAEGGTTYPWDECIADQIKQYGDEETAKNVCGAIKAQNS